MKKIYMTALMALCLAACNTESSSKGAKTIAQHLENKTKEPCKIRAVPGMGQALESYFSPDSRSLICYAKQAADDSLYHVYTLTVDGKQIKRINDKGEDACSFFFPEGDRILFTSTKDHPELPKGDWSKEKDYPRGAELYVCRTDGSHVVRLTNNDVYDAEASVSPDGKWILFSRQMDGNLDLWKMKPDGSDAFQITRTADWQEGGAFYMPDSKTILFRAWRTGSKKDDKPMTIFTILDDGTGLTALTSDTLVNWAPYPTPDGKHYVYAKMLPSHNFELFLADMKTGKEIRLTFDEAFDGFPSVSPDGRLLSFTSSRGGQGLRLYLMDLSAFNLAPI